MVETKPADQAAFLIDFEDWLGRLSERRPQSAELLAQGLGTLEVAEQVGLSPGKEEAVTPAKEVLEHVYQAILGTPEFTLTDGKKARVDPYIPPE